MSQDRVERIESIIAKRKPLADRISKVRGELSHAVDQFDGLQEVCRSVLSDEQTARELGRLQEMLDLASRPADELRRLRDDLTHIQKRFARDSLNIAVIGRARQGKSRLLQTITGLTAEEIPDGNQAFCTGVRSDIINTPSADTAYAQVNFLSEREFIDEKVAPYFQDLQEYRPDLFTPISLHDFRVLRLPEPGTFQAAPEAVTQMNLHLQHLKDLQDHLPQYQDYLGRSPLRISKEEIREYVAQDNAQGERVFFKHMAVANVEIFCRFPNVDVGKLRLIDLPGLGDTRKGDAEQVVRALSDQVDLVFFLSKPSNSGAGWQDNEINLYSQARRALGEKLPIERWSFWVFNHDSREGADNSVQCKTLRDSMNLAQIKVSDTVIVDCTNTEEVSSVLIDKALDFLAGNIERNDNEYAEKLQKSIAEAAGIMRDSLDGVGDMLTEEKDADIDADMFDELFAPLWDELQIAIQSCVGPGSELRYNKGTPCLPLKERIDKIFSEAEDGYVFPFDTQTIRKKYVKYGDTLTVYPECLHQLRTELSARMQADMDDILTSVLNGMKDQFGHILGSTGRLAGRFGSDDHELLGKLVQYIREKGYEAKMPTVLRGLELLDSWTMSYRSFAQHKIREALNCLDPMDEANTSQGVPRNEEQVLEMLTDLYEQAIYELRKSFDGPNGIYHEPNNAVFAVAEEFKDIMIRSGSNNRQLENEWKRLYRPIRGDVWTEEYGSSQKLRDAVARIRVPLQEMINTLGGTQGFKFLN